MDTRSVSLAAALLLVLTGDATDARAQVIEFPAKLETSASDRLFRWDHAESIRLYNEAVDHISSARAARASGTPAYERYRRLRGEAAAGSDDWQKALELLDKAVQKDSAVPEVHYALGYCRAADNQLDSAREHFQKAVTLRPSYSAASRALTAVSAAIENRARRPRG